MEFFFFCGGVYSNFTVSVVPRLVFGHRVGRGGVGTLVNRRSASRDRYRRAVSTSVTSQLLVPNPSDVARAVMGGGYRAQVRGGTADNRRTGRFSIPNQDVTQIHATVKRTYHPPKRITGLGSSSTTAKRLRGPTRIYKEARRRFGHYSHIRESRTEFWRERVIITRVTGRSVLHRHLRIHHRGPFPPPTGPRQHDCSSPPCSYPQDR